MPKKVLLLALLIFGSFWIRAPRPAIGLGATPAVGEWEFCSASNQVGCIESFEFETSPGHLESLPSSSQVKSSMGALRVECMSSTAAGLVRQGDPCRSSVLSGCGVVQSGYASLLVNVSPLPSVLQQDERGFEGLRYILRLRTGDFDPAFALGGQIDALQRRVVDAGHSVEIAGRIQAQYLGSPIATSVAYHSTISILNDKYLESVIDGLNGQCGSIKLSGGYIDTNANGLELSFRPQKSTDALAASISLTAFGSHFLPGSSGSDDMIVHARFKLFIPDGFLDDVGYSDPSTLSLKNISISTSDGQIPSPLISKVAGGVLIDAGIPHFSSPNPEFKIYRPGRFPGDDRPTSIRRGKRLAKSEVLKWGSIVTVPGDKITMQIKSSSGKICSVSGAVVVTKRIGVCRIAVKWGSRARGYSTGVVSVRVVAK